MDINFLSIPLSFVLFPVNVFYPYFALLEFRLITLHPNCYSYWLLKSRHNYLTLISSSLRGNVAQA